MILADANLLLYAYDEASPHHARARPGWSVHFRAGTFSGFRGRRLLHLSDNHQRAGFQHPMSMRKASGLSATFSRIRR